MAKIKSVKLNTGQTVQVGSKAYNKYTSSGSTAVSGTGKNLTSKDIKSVGGGFTDKPSMTGTGVVNEDKTFGTPVDTSQPTPGATPVGAQTAQTPGAQIVPYDQAVKGLETSGQPKADIERAKGSLAQMYGQAHAQTTASGTPPPPTMGGAGSTIQGSIPPPPPPSPIAGIMETDTNFDSILTEMDKWYSPPEQKKSLLQEYQSMSKALGIQDINEELIDAKRIIEGTEDDIRSEVTAAGGFATDSQVLALANARNKSLVKNYNYLLEARDNAMQQLDTMMDLSIQDRKMAEDEFDRKLNFAFKVSEFKERATNNARDQFKYLIDSGFGSALLQSPYETQLAEKTLGLPSGGLSKIVSETQKTTDLERQYKQAQIDNIYSDIGARNADNTVMVDMNGKVVLNQKEAMKINKEITASDAYKAITKGKDSLQFLKNFEATFDKTGATSAVFSPRQNAKLKAEYNQAILNLKEFFNLGVLNGPDEAILRAVLPDPTNRSAFLTTVSGGIYKPSTSTRAGIDSMKKMIESSLDERYKSLTSQYGDYSGQSLGAINDLNRIYVEQKAKVNPEVEKLLEENPDLTEDDVIMILTE